ncbi:hypothetical protein RFI_39489, partial [Reticulomyxa filosa]
MYWMCFNEIKQKAIGWYKNKYIRKLCEQSLETISIKLNDKQLDRVCNGFIHGLKDTNKWDRGSCAESLGIIATKASEKQVEKFVNALTSGLKDKNYWVHKSCAKSLG